VGAKCQQIIHLPSSCSTQKKNKYKKHTKQERKVATKRAKEKVGESGFKLNGVLINNTP